MLVAAVALGACGSDATKAPTTAASATTAAAAATAPGGTATGSSAAGSPSGAPTGATSSLTIGYSAWPGWFPLAVADKAGIFTKVGLDVDLKYFVDYTASLDALVA